MAAAFVIGQSNFSTSGSGTFKTPTDVGVDSSGNIYVADNGDNRVLIYPSLVFLPLSGGTPTGAARAIVVDRCDRRTTIRRTGWRRRKGSLRL